MFLVIVKWLVMCFFDKVVCGLALIFSPITSLFVDRNGDMKYLRRYLQTPDSDMWGYPGDADFYNDHYFDTCWWTALCWQWRNTAQGFSTFVMGLDETNLKIVEKYRSGEGQLVKYLKIAYEEIDGADEIVGFEWKGSFRWFGTDYRFRWRLGWKFGWAEGLPAQLILSFSPFKKITG